MSTGLEMVGRQRLKSVKKYEMYGTVIRAKYFFSEAYLKPSFGTYFRKYMYLLDFPYQFEKIGYRICWFQKVSKLEQVFKGRKTN